MIRFTVIALLSAVFMMTACLAGTPSKPPKETRAQCSLVVFEGASSKMVVEGEITHEEYKKWFTQNYNVAGERIETPKSSDTFGALVLTSGAKTLVMPLCTWQIESGHIYFACQSGAIGQAPRFRVCTESKTKKEFLNQMEQELAKLQENGG